MSPSFIPSQDQVGEKPASQDALFRRRLNGVLPQAASAQGIWITDTAGKTYLDAAGGCLVTNVGHGVPEIAEALGRQAATLPYINGTQFTNHPAEALANALAPHLESSLPDPRCYFVTTGSEAVEAAVKFVRQLWVERKKPDKWYFISRTPSYHGNTLMDLSLSGREQYRKAFQPLLHPIEKIDAPQGDGQDHLRAEQLEAAIRKIGPAYIAAFVAEPISGSSTGGVIPDDDYWPIIQEICQRYNVLLIMDEVMTGMGRTGRWLASEHFGLKPDIVTLGKGLNGGYAPLSAMVARGALVDEIARGSGNFLHAGTYSHTPVICSAGLATVNYLERHQLVERSESLGKVLHRRLAKLKKHPWVGRINGRGLFAGIEFLVNPQKRTPFPRQVRFIEKLVTACMENGLIVWPNTGHIDGLHGDLLMLGPPFIITEDEIEELVRRLEKSLDCVEATLCD